MTDKLLLGFYFMVAMAGGLFLMDGLFDKLENWMRRRK